MIGPVSQVCSYTRRCCSNSSTKVEDVADEIQYGGSIQSHSLENLSQEPGCLMNGRPKTELDSIELQDPSSFPQPLLACCRGDCFGVRRSEGLQLLVVATLRVETCTKLNRKPRKRLLPTIWARMAQDSGTEEIDCVIDPPADHCALACRQSLRSDRDDLSRLDRRGQLCTCTCVFSHAVATPAPPIVLVVSSAAKRATARGKCGAFQKPVVWRLLASVFCDIIVRWIAARFLQIK